MYKTSTRQYPCACVFIEIIINHRNVCLLKFTCRYKRASPNLPLKISTRKTCFFSAVMSFVAISKCVIILKMVFVNIYFYHPGHVFTKIYKTNAEHVLWLTWKRCLFWFKLFCENVIIFIYKWFISENQNADLKIFVL